MRALVVAVCFAFIGSAQAAEPNKAHTVTSLKMSSTPPPNASRIVEFRARATHVFVLTGYELADGTAIYTSLRGFYPQGAGGATVSQMISSPGEVTMTIKDEGPYRGFRYEVTEAQANNVDHILSRWNGTQYEVMNRNCMNLVEDVAGSLGLETSPKGEGLEASQVQMGSDAGMGNLLPINRLLYISALNKKDRPLKFAEQQARERANSIEADNIVARYTATHQKPVTGNRPDGGSSVIPSVPDVWLPPTTSGGGTSQPAPPVAPPPPPPQAKPPAPPINKTPVENRPL